MTRIFARASQGVGRRAFRPGVDGLESRLALSTASTAPLPPWETYRAELNATVGNTIGVSVSPLIAVDANHYVVNVSSYPLLRDLAMATVLNATKTYGDVTVTVRVLDGYGNPVSPVKPKSPSQLQALERYALMGNPQFVWSYVRKINAANPVGVFPVFTKSVIQIPNGNVGDYYGNFNAVTAAVYADVLKPSVEGFSVYPSTAKS